MTKYDLVEKALERYPRARENGTYCYCKVGVIMGVITERQSEDLFEMMKKVGNPRTYRRTRQTLQNETRPDLGPSRAVAKRNKEIEKEARASSGKNIVYGDSRIEHAKAKGWVTN